MRVVVRQRLARIPPEGRRLLRIAALAGREIDPNLLSHFATHAELDDWLLHCEMNQILEIRENVWRFAHDKLREGVVVDIPAADHPGLHAAIAAALVDLHGEALPHAARIAHHYREAGDHRQEATYAVRAGKHALTQAVYNEAHEWFKRALDLAEAGGFSRIQRAEIEHRLTDVCMGLGLMNDYVQHARQAVIHLGFSLPETRAQMLSVIGRQVGHTLRTPARKAPVGSPAYTAGIILQEMAAVMHVTLQQTVDAVATALHSINLLETVENSPELASGYATMSIAMQSQKLQRFSRHYLIRAERILAHLTPQRSVAFGNMHRALGYAYVFRGEWEKARHSNEVSSGIFEAVGDLARWNSVMLSIAVMEGLVGDFNASHAARQQVMDLAEQSHNLRAVTWGLVGIGQMALYRDDLDAAADAFERREAINQQIAEAGEFNPVWTYRAALYWRRGDRDSAMAALANIRDEIGTAITLDNAHDIYSVFNIADVAFGLLEDQPEDATLLDTGEKALSYLREYADRYPVGEPRLLLYTALYQQLTGHPRKAQQIWIQARQRAHQLHMPYEQALAYALSGKYEAHDTRQREAHLKRAESLLREIGALWDLRRLPD
jgi:tetratricopeptide (TPR) repeat protein